MDLTMWIILGSVVILAGYVLATYNRFATARVRIKASIQEIGNQLKRQADLIPNLEASAKGYLEHEKGIYKQITDARAAVSKAQKSGSVEDAGKAGDLIAKLIPAMQIAVESNPEIKGSEVVTQLMNELRDTSDKLMYARRTLIDLAADYNTGRVTFPSSLIANMFGFGEDKGLATPESGDFTNVSEEETKTPKVTL